MAVEKGKIFVGREEELKKFGEVLAEQKGQAILVVGNRGMGKTWLINKMAQLAEIHPKLKCGWVRYEVTPTDSVDSTMTLMMDNALEAALAKAGSFDDVPERRKQWRTLLKLAKLVPAGKLVGKALGDKVELIGELWKSLQRDPVRNTREQFLERLRLISKRMPKNGRAIFIIDPEKYMQKESDQSWAIVVRDLPERIKFIFAQRTEDALVDSETFSELGNVVRIPKKRLDILSEQEVDDLLNSRKEDLKCSIPELRKVLGRYRGYPYAVGAALDLLEAGTRLEELPKKPEPTRFAEAQWKELSKRGAEAICLFKAYAILEVGVPDTIVEQVSGLDKNTLQHLVADKFLSGLLREEGAGMRIYHAILADFVLGQMGDEEKKDYHKWAVGVYRGKLAKAKKEQIKPDELAAMRLAEHVLAAEGEKAFVKTFVNECTEPLVNLHLDYAAINLSERALGMVKKGSVEEAAVLGNLRQIYQMKRDIKNFLIKRLKRPERLIIVLYHYEEMTMKEIGATLDLSEYSVSKMHSSIIGRLKALMNSRQKKKFFSIE